MKKYEIDLMTLHMKQARNLIRSFRRKYNLSGDTVRILEWRKDVENIIVVKFDAARFEEKVDNLKSIQLQLFLHLQQYRINQHTRRLKYE